MSGDSGGGAENKYNEGSCSEDPVEVGEELEASYGGIIDDAGHSDSRSQEDEASGMPCCDHSSFEAEISKLRKELEAANRVKETMVMRYAKSENEVIRKTEAAEIADRQLKASLKENEYLSRRNKMLSSERERLVSLVDSRGCEVQALKREIERLQEDVSGKDFQLKWTQSKLQGEQEAHKNTTSRLEKCESDLNEAMDQVRRMKEECKEMTTCDGDNLENDGNQISEETALNTPVKSSSKHTLVSNAPTPDAFVKEIGALKQKHRTLIEENNSLSCKVQSLEVSRLDQEQKINRLQELNASYLTQLGNLQSELAEAESYKVQLGKIQDRIACIQSECDQLRTSNAELLSDMAVCREKEAELLTYTQQVTDKNVQLQSQFSAVEAQSALLTEENKRLQSSVRELEENWKEAEKARAEGKIQFKEMATQFKFDLEDKENIIQTIQAKLDEARGEIALMKKKHEVAIRELRKELENSSRQRKEDSLGGISSRTSSSTSLNQVDSARPPSEATTPTQAGPVNSNNLTSSPTVPDQQTLVERIVKLQRALAKKDEKIEFLQEHSKQLLEGIQLKSKIIQAHAMSQEVGALTTEVLPHHKYTLERQLSSELAKKGGLSKGQGEDTMTLELSLDINRKLQAVLEDSLLKNITLKESMRTLGSEVCRLTELNKELSEKVQGGRLK